MGNLIIFEIDIQYYPSSDPVFSEVVGPYIVMIIIESVTQLFSDIIAGLSGQCLKIIPVFIFHHLCLLKFLANCPLI